MKVLRYTFNIKKKSLQWYLVWDEDYKFTPPTIETPSSTDIASKMSRHTFKYITKYSSQSHILAKNIIAHHINTYKQIKVWKSLKTFEICAFWPKIITKKYRFRKKSKWILPACDNFLTYNQIEIKVLIKEQLTKSNNK